MSIGPSAGIVGSAAGAPIAQTKGSEAERAAQETGGQQRKTHTDQNATDAAGIGQTSQDEQSSDRDADGRRFWEKQESASDDPQTEGPTETPLPESKAKDATGMSGNRLDLSG